VDKHRTNAASRGIGASRWDSQSLTIPTPTGEIDYLVLAIPLDVEHKLIRQRRWDKQETQEYM